MGLHFDAFWSVLAFCTIKCLISSNMQNDSMGLYWVAAFNWLGGGSGDFPLESAEELVPVSGAVWASGSVGDP